MKTFRPFNGSAKSSGFFKYDSLPVYHLLKESTFRAVIKVMLFETFLRQSAQIFISPNAVLISIREYWTSWLLSSSYWLASVSSAVIYIAPGTLAPEFSILITRLYQSSAFLTYHRENNILF